MKENSYIRERARAAKVPLWRIAAFIGISEPTLIRWLRFPLPPDKESRILEAISELKKMDREYAEWISERLEKVRNESRKYEIVRRK